LDLSELVFDAKSFGYKEIKTWVSRSSKGDTLTFYGDGEQMKSLRNSVAYFTNKHDWDIPVNKQSDKEITITNGGPIYTKQPQRGRVGDRGGAGDSVHHNSSRKNTEA
jgi:hypothetical protein